MNALEKAIDEFLQTGRLDPAVARQLRDLTDATVIDAVMAKLKSAGADVATSNPLMNIEDCSCTVSIVPGEAKYDQRWPVTSGLLPVPFGELDRRSQFFVLFREWSRREFEAMHALMGGDVYGAEEAFQECVERAIQLGVAELEARSYEGLVRVAQRRDDADAARRWLDIALAIRERMP